MFSMWWQKITQHRVAIGVVVFIAIVLLALIIAGYRINWTGFGGYIKETTARTISGKDAGTVIRTEEYQQGKKTLGLATIAHYTARTGYWWILA